MTTAKQALATDARARESTGGGTTGYWVKRTGANKRGWE